MIDTLKQQLPQKQSQQQQKHQHQQNQRWRFMVWAALTTCLLLSLYSQTGSLRQRWLPQKGAVSADRCSGRRVYVYELPPDFNEEVVRRACEEESIKWMCNTYANHGMGLPARTSAAQLAELMAPLEREQRHTSAPSPASPPPSSPPPQQRCSLLPAAAWFRTEQFAVEPLLHQRMRRYDCPAATPDQADLLYIPYYAGADVRQYLFGGGAQMRDRLAQRLLGWLQAAAPSAWRRRSGRDHLLVLGRIAWDFTRVQEMESAWGSSLLSIPALANVTKLLVERNQWSRHSQMAIPYPTGFHPSSQGDIDAWIASVAASRRDVRVSFAGAPRPGTSGAAQLRDAIHRQCAASPDCALLRCDAHDCAANPELVTCLALRSVFCLMPPGDSPTRKALFDSLLAGCVPVFFTPDSAYDQYLWHLPGDGESYSILLDKPEQQQDVVSFLLAIPDDTVRRMQQNVAALVPRIVYAQHHIPGASDAFDIIMDRVFTFNRD